MQTKLPFRPWARLAGGALRLAGGLLAGVVVGLWWLLARGGRTLRALPHLGRMVQCPRGCPPQPVDGWFRCRACGGTFLGYSFGPCPGCGVVAGQQPCSHCGHLIVNPLVGS